MRSAILAVRSRTGGRRLWLATEPAAAAGRPKPLRPPPAAAGRAAAAIVDSAKPRRSPSREAAPATTHALGGERLAYATVAERETVAYDEPGGRPIATFGLHNENGHVMVFGVRRVVLDEDCRIEWYRVRLPMRPNGSEGYVHADDVRLVRRDTRIAVDLSERQLVLYRRASRS